MKPEELDERLADAENVLAIHGKRIADMEEREIKSKGQEIKVSIR